VFFHRRRAKLNGRRPECARSLAALAIAAICTASCTSDRPAPPREPARIELTDDGGTVVRLDHPARRIVSLVPSATETLVAIGAMSDIVGRTRYDMWPEVASLPSVGGGMDASVEAIVNLHPDLVIAWRSEAPQNTRDRLMSLGVPVFQLKTEDTSDVFRNIVSMGRLTGRDSAALAIASSVRGELDAVRREAAGQASPTVFYVVGDDPPMTAGPRTFIAQLISLAGGRSIFTDSSRLWPTVAMEAIVRGNPDLLIVPAGDTADPINRLRSLPGWRDLRAVRTGRVAAVPADLVNRPSPSIARSARVLLAAIHPEAAKP
jgi:iron complex transport system substrate-binding protein